MAPAQIVRRRGTVIKEVQATKAVAGAQDVTAVTIVAEKQKRDLHMARVREISE